MCRINASACVVSYGNFDEVCNTITSVNESTKGVNLSLFIVDNASPDGTGQKLLKQNFGQNTIILPQDENKGFGSGHNVVLPLINSKYHAVINPDIILNEDAISTLCNYLEQNEHVVMVTPRLIFENGQEQYTSKRAPTFMALLSRQLPLPFLKKFELYYQMRDRDLTKAQEIDFCTGCFFVMRTDVFKKIGGFDEGYFMYVEDADITRKAKEYGKVMYVPLTKVTHLWHRTPNKKISHFYLQIKSMFRYWRKWGFHLYKH